jgi:amino acid adenylation domain-containing protein
MENLADRLAALSPKKRAMLTLALQQKGAEFNSFPLSFTQQRLWFLDQLEPDTDAYTIFVAYQLTGRLDRAVLERSLNEIVRRHAALRTTFPIIDEQPIQAISPAAALPLPLEDLRSLPADEREAAVRRYLAAEARRPFDLARGPLIRAGLLWVDDETHVLALSMHHIVSDLWSMGVFMGEMAELYAAFTTGRPAELAPLPIQYPDFARWQRQWLQGETLEKQLTYWKQQLAGVPPMLDLPLDHPRPAIQTHQGARQQLTLGKALTASLAALGQQEGATPFMMLLAAFQTLLCRYTRQEDIVVGSPIAGRTRAETEGLIGCFLNTLALRTDLSGNPTFRELLRRVREVAMGAYSHQDLPFEMLLEEIQPERDLTRNAVFQALFVLQNTPAVTLELPGLTVSPMGVEVPRAHLDLSLWLGEGPQGLVGFLEYNTDLFDAATIARMARHFETLLASITADPDQRILDIVLLTAEERHQALVEWNTTEMPFPTDRCFHQLFEAQAERMPDNIAVVCQDRRLSYRQLNQRANGMARRLVEYGVGPDIVVALLIERDIDLLTTIMAVFKAGGAYLPLDPHHPAPRHAQVLAQSKSPLVLTTQAFTPTLAQALERLPAGAQPQVLPIEEFLGEDEAGNLPPRCTPAHLAYVIYTSGSTGVPKGAMVEHYGMLNHLHAKIADLALSDADQVAQTASQCFDISVWQFLAALLLGGTVQVFPDTIAHDPRLLIDRVEQERITVLETVPALLRAMLEDLDGRKKRRPTLAALRWLLVTGEALPPDLCRQWLRSYPAIPLMNAYGPTECSDDVTHYPLAQAPGAEELHVPIGRPVANMRLYVLDARMEPVPPGVAGELYVGGIGVGRGYLYDPARTSAAFVPDPFAATDDPFDFAQDGRRPTTDDESNAGGGRWSVVGGRLYRTGDLVRQRPDGALIFLGRIDDQVKLRGFRIELGEIETVLRQHGAVQEAAVIDREDRPGDVALVAYVVPNADYQPPVDQAEQAGEHAWQDEQVARWQAIYDDAYSQEAPVQDPTFNTSSWNSSYTTQPLIEAEMREYVNRTVERVLALRPQRVLEIGCGMGLLLFRIAPHTVEYCGTDISPVALGHVEQHLPSVAGPLPPVRLLRQEADDFSGIAGGSFDAVVLNSVVQLFPSIDYVVRVLEGAVGAVRPGGAVFIGDVRSLPLLETYHTSVQVYRADSELTKGELRRRVRRGVARDKDLIIDPAFFFALKQHIPAISHVQVQLKRGRYHNEFTRFRYDVTLHVGAAEHNGVEHTWLDWQEHGLTVAEVRRMLEEGTPEALHICQVPNARLRADLLAQAWLAGGPDSETVGELQATLGEQAAQDAVDPEELWALCDRLPYSAAITFSTSGADGLYDVVFWPRGAAGTPVPPILPEQPAQHKPWRQYANNPLQSLFAEEVVPQLRDYLKASLPEYMVPAAFVLLDTLPLTPNGKLDRRALPPPDEIRSGQAETFVAPRDELERQLVEIWENLLNIRPIGVTDSFFDIGGHSIMAVRLMSQIYQRYGERLPLATLFEEATVAHLAGLLRQQIEPPPWSPVVNIQPGAAKRPFFCVHAAGGNVLSYHEMGQNFDPERPLYGLQAVGFDGTPPHTTLEAMAELYNREIRKCQPEGPYMIGGWCLGGKIAYEMARQFHAQGQQVALLVLFDTSARHDLQRVPVVCDADIALLWKPELKPLEESLMHLDPEDRFVYFIEEGRRQGIVTTEWDLEQIRAFLRLQWAMVIAELDYQPRPYDGRVVLFRATDRPEDQPLDLWWGELAQEGVEIVFVPGDHMSIIEDNANVAVLAQRLCAHLDAADQATDVKKGEFEGEAPQEAPFQHGALN